LTETTKWYIVWLSGFDRTIKWYKKAGEILVVISSFTQTIKYYKKIVSVSSFTQTIKYYKKQDQRPFSPMMLVKCSAMLDNAGMIDHSIKWNILTNYKAYIMCICSPEHLEITQPYLFWKCMTEFIIGIARIFSLVSWGFL